MLVIGCGAGVTAGAVSIDPALKSETIAEIEPLVPEVVSKYFGAHNYNVVTNPKVHVQIDDARHFILTTKQKFDAVTSDPLDPWVKGAATLYTKEFFDVVKEHLNPGGVVTLFVQLYESSTEAVKSEVATFFQAFPNGVVFGNTNNGGGYDLVLVGQMGTMKIDVDAIEQRLASPQYAQVAQSLREIGFNSATELFATFAGNEPMLRPWLADAQINHDRNLRLQFLAGLRLEPLRPGGDLQPDAAVPAVSRRICSSASPERLAQIRNGDGGLSGVARRCRSERSRRLSFADDAAGHAGPPFDTRSSTDAGVSPHHARAVLRRFRYVRAAVLRPAADAGVRARLSRRRGA